MGFELTTTTKRQDLSINSLVKPLVLPLAALRKANWVSRCIRKAIGKKSASYYCKIQVHLHFVYGARLRMLSFLSSPHNIRKDVAELGKFSRTRVIRGMKYLLYEELINRLGPFSLEEDHWKTTCKSMNDMQKVNKKLLFTVSSSTRTSTSTHQAAGS